MSLADWVVENRDLLWELTVAHVALSLPPLLLGLLIALPLGMLAAKQRLAGSVLVALSNALYTVPSLPLLLILPLLLGTTILSPLNLIVALTLFAVALLLRQAQAAFAAVPASAQTAAVALGFSAVQRAVRVELPLAIPVLIAGARVVSASTISLVSVGALIGVQSLGYLFVNGFQRGFIGEIVVGIIATVAIAGLFDGVLVLAGYALTPWLRGNRSGGGR